MMGLGIERRTGCQVVRHESCQFACLTGAGRRVVRSLYMMVVRHQVLGKCISRCDTVKGAQADMREILVCVSKEKVEVGGGRESVGA